MREIEKAIKFIKKDVRHDVNEHEHYYIDLAIQALEKQLNGGWIPINEKSPKFDINYLVTTENGDVFTSKFYGYGEECQGFKEFPEGVWEVDELGETVIAWQPLPEPYKEVEGENRSKL